MKTKSLYKSLAVLVSIMFVLNWQIQVVRADKQTYTPQANKGSKMVGWIQNTFQPEIPGPRSGSTLAYDSVRHVLVLFGGCSTQALGDTWEWNGVAWTQRFPSSNPSPRCFHTMAFDSARGVVVLFSGIGQGGGFLNDTWEWDGNNWTERTPTNYPSARMTSAMIFDSARGVSVLFGGNTWGQTPNDTWVWDGDNWTQLSPANSPPGRHSHVMVYDTKRGVTVLFGGYNYPTNQVLADTWEWDGVNWVEKQPANFPQARFRHAMAYDSTRGVTVLFGGMLDPNVHILSDETWEWDGSNWKEYTFENRPSARIYHAMAYDHVRHTTILLAGYDCVVDLGDTWEYIGEKNPRR